MRVREREGVGVSDRERKTVAQQETQYVGCVIKASSGQVIIKQSGLERASER